MLQRCSFKLGIPLKAVPLFAMQYTILAASRFVLCFFISFFFKSFKEKEGADLYRNRLIFGATLYTEPPYIRSHLIYGATLYSEPPCIRSHLIYGATLYSEPPYIRRHLIYGATLYTEPPYIRSHLIYGAAWCFSIYGILIFPITFYFLLTLLHRVRGRRGSFWVGHNGDSFS
jgi:hypothetical protein